MTIAATPGYIATTPSRWKVLAWGLAAFSLLLMVGCQLLLVTAGVKADRPSPFPWAFMAVFAVLGGLIGSRHPRNAIGWIFAGTAVSVAIGSMAASYAMYWVDSGGGPQLLARIAAAYAYSSWIPWIMIPATFLVLLFPDGHLLSRRWRPVAWCAGIGIVLAFLMESAQPGTSPDYPPLTNPFGMDEGLRSPLDGLALFMVLIGTVGAAASLIVRFRRSSGLQRQQIKWLTSAGAAVAIIVPITFVAYDALGENLANITIMASVLTLPVAAGIAILKYRLYDIDVVINKTVVFVLLVGFITAVYAAIVVGLGRLLPIGQGNLGLAIVATAVVAVVFEPVRVRVQHWANHLVYGRRASPYETLAAMTRSMGESADPTDALGEAARLLAEGTGAAQAVVWVARDGFLTPRATAGDDTTHPSPVSFNGPDLPPLNGVALVEPVRHEGKLVGALSLSKRPGEGVNSTDRRLVEELAGQASLLLANTRLRSRLGDRLVELRLSRQRMITAQDRARHALERDLHDGAQQELVALKIKLGLARTIATREGATTVAERLTGTVEIADRAVDTLRDVARGIYPPLLESEGLAAALSAQVRRVELSITVLDRASTRYPRELEATAYFCALEALRNAVKHANASNAHVELDGTDNHLVVTVTDDGDGFDTDREARGDGLTHMADRIDAMGGALSIASQPGHGTTITFDLQVSVDQESVRT